MDGVGTNTSHTSSSGVTSTSAFTFTATAAAASTPTLPGSDAALLNRAYYRSLSAEQRQQYDFHHQLPGEPSQQAVVAILSLSVLVFLCSSLVLLATRYTSGGQSGTLVFLRSLLLSDILMALYGVTKMGMLLFLHELRVNFFLPDSFFFTASLASTSSLLSLNLDCFIKLARPFEYAQVEKHTVITFMLLVWNAAFVVGFLPLAGWHEEACTFRFFSFYPWHFLLFNGLVVFICVVICIACMVSLKKFYVLPDTYPTGYSTRMIEVRKYRHLHRTIVMESAMWLTCYLPFFIYISLACRQCSLGHYRHSDSTIIYFLPLFLAKSLFSAALQAFRTFHVHSVMNKIITDISNMASPRQRRHEASFDDRDNSVATIAYTNPLSEQSDFPSLHSNSSERRPNNFHGHHHHHHYHHHEHQPHCPLYQETSSGHHEDLHLQSFNVLPNMEDGAHNFVLDDDNWTIHHRDLDNMRQQSGFVHNSAVDGDYHDDIPVMAADAIQMDVTDDILGITNFAYKSSINLSMQHESTKL